MSKRFALLTVHNDNPTESYHSTLVGAMSTAQEAHDLRIDWEAPWDNDEPEDQTLVLQAYDEMSEREWFIYQL